ncbi:uncharacterized protein BYT42DRAFT_570265 [Radiomyces spectabilis]|uniref:uncharacterized protein n=1 Tax=Radiomyces spectabilis TaxID=64574 RepID=UPI00221F37A5|nr:uncharacterized protein BYT42DRAFT_570265 [Radiomyces spectabilis]KAI8377414.1 hypothetical protein BYT42DRAFT_570265 [Radiomyces spectabilis]
MPVPFFSGGKQLSIELAEPVIILRGLPSDPTTHVLRGEVELVLSKPLAASAVMIKLVGKSHMLWPEGLGARGTKVYHEKTIHEQNIILQSWPEDYQGDKVLPAGLSRWPFEFLISNRLVETIEDEMAKVYYYISATVHKISMIGSPVLRARRNVLLLRTLTWSDSALTSHALPSTSIIAERHLDACDATIAIEKSIVSSGTQFPISLVISPHLKNVHLESLSIVLSEKRVYQLPEFQARRGEMYDFKLQLASVANMADQSLSLQGLVPCSDVPLQHLRRALSAKNAHIPLVANPFQYRFIFTLPNCVHLNHTTFFNEMNFVHYLKINIELSVPNKDNSTTERTHIHLDTPITILDCRLKEDYSVLPTYAEALSDPTFDEEDQEDPTGTNHHAAGFFICPCYQEFKKRSTSTGRQEWLKRRQEWLAHRQDSDELLPPPPPYKRLDAKSTAQAAH